MKTLVVLILCLLSITLTLETNEIKRVKRIIGGTPAGTGRAPWQVSLVSSGWFGDSHICGGSLIGRRTVLTSARCCDGSSASSLKVKYGGLDRTKLATTNTVTKVLISPEWNTNTIDSDYCILTLANSVQETDNVKLIPIADQSPATGAQAMVSGWGRTSYYTMILPYVLQYIPMSIVSATDCNPKWSDVNPITKTMICAQNDAATPWTGDDGGPLVVNSKLVGVISWGLDKVGNRLPANTKRPYVFADTAVVKAWIVQNTQ